MAGRGRLNAALEAVVLHRTAAIGAPPHGSNAAPVSYAASALRRSASIESATYASTWSRS